MFIPRSRRKTIFGQIRQHLGEVFHKLAAQKESRIEEGQPDHVHILISILPKYAVSQVVGVIRGKGAIHIAPHIRREETKFRWPMLLGSRVFRLHRGA